MLAAKLVMGPLPSLQVTIDVGDTGGGVVLACCVRGVVEMHEIDWALRLDFSRLSACNDHEEAFLPGQHRSYEERARNVPVGTASRGGATG